MKQSSLLKFLSSAKKAIEEKQMSFQKQDQAEPKLSRLKKQEDCDEVQNENSMDIENYVFQSTQSSKKSEKIQKSEKVQQSENVQQKRLKQKEESKEKKEKRNDQNMIEEDEQQLQKATDFFQKSECIYDDFDDATPEWAQEGKSRDKNGKLHLSGDADPTTLFIPDQAFKKLTKSMQQYWTFKSTNFDKIIFFKLGKFYELFYEDALIGHKYLDLNWMGKKMHTGFPEKAVNKFSKALMDYGFKVVIIDQVETPDEMQRRVKENRKSGVGNTDKIVKRELSYVLTKGTYLYEEGENESNPDERILMVIRKRIIDSQNEEYGVAMLERQTNTISLAMIADKEKLKTILLHMRPVEVVLDPHNIPSYDVVSRMIKGNVLRSVVSYLSQKVDNWDSRKGLFRLESVYQETGLPKAIQFYKDQELVMQAMSGLFSYLFQIQIMERVLESARFKVYDEQYSLQQCLILDSQALFHLEILESSEKQDKSLFNIINKTTTPEGHRLLRKWVCAPLFQIKHIRERQEAVQDLTRFKKERDLLRQSIKGYPDLERMSSRIYEYSVKTESKAIFYENFSQIRLKEFRILINKLRELQWEFSIFGELANNFKSQRLIKMFTLQEQGGLLPNVSDHLDDFENYIKWDGVTPQPIKGVLDSYDEAEQEVKAVEDELNQYLEVIRIQFKNDKNINYAHAKFRYEIEVPLKYVEDQKPDDFEFTSTRSGFKRFHTKQIKDLVTKLEEAEENRKKQLCHFVRFVFTNFKNNQNVWDSMISILAEIDALSSLSVYGDNNDQMCWPQFQNDITLQIEQGRHPCLLDINFVPNNVDMGSNNEKFLLLTGPNMGGKSTTLRMTCILTILAQMGCQVPCKSMILSPVDRIFTRIGARDYLIEGKSTFFVELEETLVPLRNATINSLFIADELGRGTSTYDGVAIASAVMKHLINRIRCRVMFATHFRILVEEAKLMSGVTNVHMASYVEGGSVVFLYFLKAGACPASFGINVAKAVGIEQSIINRAEEMAEFFENKVSKNVSQILGKYNNIIESIKK